jgi:hypothetical protein
MITWDKFTKYEACGGYNEEQVLIGYVDYLGSDEEVLTYPYKAVSFFVENLKNVRYVREDFASLKEAKRWLTKRAKNKTLVYG